MGRQRASRAVPLTERILDRLPGRRSRWMVTWALVPWLNLAAVLVGQTAGWSARTDRSVEVVNRIAVSFAVLLSLWGAARISKDLEQLRLALTQAVEQEESDVRRLFPGVGSAVVPVVLTLAVGVALPVDELLGGDPVAAVLQAVTWLLIGIPLSTAVWVYLTLELGLRRLGQGRLTLRGYRGDRTLGLQPVGSLAFTGFWMLVGAVTPLVLTGSSDLPTVLVGILVLAVGVGLFFLSLQGVHRQMATVRQREIDRATTLYQQAYERLDGQPTLEVLQQQVGLLNAAEALEKRAERIQAWPFDEAMFARVATIATSAAASILARLLLAPTGI